jgi:3'-phosphoadenosine 5'-phosphosulfate sulfotransferase (PAPS reductase)/FAD synthetase
MSTHLVSYSGGLGSFAAAYLTAKTFGPENVQLIFTDTKTEDEDLYRFMNESAKALALPLTVLADGRNIWEVMHDVRYQANSRVDPCSRVLKRELFRKHVEKNFDCQLTTIVFGIDDREAHRMDSIRRNWAPWATLAPLTINPMSREQILDVLDDLGVAPPRLYEMGFPHNNCGGFCVKTGQKQMKMLLDKLPERYRWHEEQQEKLFSHLGKEHGFIRKTVGGEMSYLSLKNFREQLERGEPAEMWPQEGCGCFV